MRVLAVFWRLAVFCLDVTVALVAIPYAVVVVWTWGLCRISGMEAGYSFVFGSAIGPLGVLASIVSAPIAFVLCRWADGGRREVTILGAGVGVCLSSMIVAEMTARTANSFGVGLVADHVFVALAGGIPAGTLAGYAAYGFIARASRKYALRRDAKAASPVEACLEQATA